MRLGHSWLPWCVLGIALLFVRPAWAALRVVLVVSGGAQERDAPIATRLHSELVAAGFDVRTVPSTDPPSILLLKNLAEREAAAAAVAIVSSPDSVSGIVWMRDSEAERVLVRRVPEEPRSADSPAVFAIRATDLLHGGLLQLGYPRPKPAEADPSAPPNTGPPPPENANPVVAPAKPPRKPAEPVPRQPAKRKGNSAGPRPQGAAPERAWEIMAGASALWGPGGDSQALPWMFAPAIGLEWRIFTAWALELRVAAPAMGSAGSSDDVVDVDQELALLGGGWRGRVGSLVHVAASAGPGIYRIGIDGERPVFLPLQGGRRRPPPFEPNVTYESYSHRFLFGCVYAGTGLELYAASRVTVRVSADMVFPMRRVELGLANQQTVQSGVPIVLATLGLGFRI